jgi:CubicO group peptidase (beta-lactamase class C family)
MRDGTLNKIDDELRGWVESRDFSGAALITVGGQPVFTGYYGLANRADGVPITPRTRFGLASLTKMFTAVTVADLVRGGKLTFDTRVVDVVPPERRPSTLLPEVTVAHLLSHTSGIADYFEEEDDDLDYGELFAERPAYRILRPADFLPFFGDLPPYRPPGGRFQYSNAGYILLGIVIEDVTGEPYTQAARRHVFEPAGMSASGFFPTDEVHPDIAMGYLPPREPGGPLRTNIYSIPPIGTSDGGAYSNPTDLDRFLTVYGSGELLGPELRDILLTPRAEVATGLWMGYGVYVRTEGIRRYGHGGGDPGFEVLVHRYPELDANLVAQANVEDLTGDVRDLLAAAVEELAGSRV